MWKGILISRRAYISFLSIFVFLLFIQHKLYPLEQYISVSIGGIKYTKGIVSEKGDLSVSGCYERRSNSYIGFGGCITWWKSNYFSNMVEDYIYSLSFYSFNFYVGVKVLSFLKSFSLSLFTMNGGVALGVDKIDGFVLIDKDFDIFLYRTVFLFSSFWGAGISYRLGDIEIFSRFIYGVVFDRLFSAFLYGYLVGLSFRL